MKNNDSIVSAIVKTVFELNRRAKDLGMDDVKWELRVKDEELLNKILQIDGIDMPVHLLPGLDRDEIYIVNPKDLSNNDPRD